MENLAIYLYYQISGVFPRTFLVTPAVKLMLRVITKDTKPKHQPIAKINNSGTGSLVSII